MSENAEEENGKNKISKQQKRNVLHSTKSTENMLDTGDSYFPTILSHTGLLRYYFVKSDIRSALIHQMVYYIELQHLDRPLRKA